MRTPLLPHVPVGRLFGLVEAMAETPGPDDVYRLAERLRLRLDELQPALEAARLLAWARVERGDFDLTEEGLRVAAGSLAERRALFRERARSLPLVASVLRSLAAGDRVPREEFLESLRAHVPPPEAERQLDTAVNWGRFAGLFDYDADDACFLRPEEAGGR